MSRTKASLLLIFVFMARGTSFLFSKTLMSELSPMSVLAVRFIMSFIVLAALFHKKLVEADNRCIRHGMMLGVLYTICMSFEMYGLRLVDTGVSSLIENMAKVSSGGKCSCPYSSKSANSKCTWHSGRR